MRFINNSINNRLVAGFGICILLMVAIVGYNYASLLKLERIYQQALKRTVDMELATDAKHIGEDLYLVISNGVIHRDIAGTEREWTRVKEESLARLGKVTAAADTPEEHLKVGEARSAIEEIIRIFEQEMLPLIRNGVVVHGALEDADVRVDKLIVDIALALKWTAKSISEENRVATEEFHAVLARAISFGVAISLIGVLAVLSISTLTIRRIVRTLSELTRAAMEMEKGNYRFELRPQPDDEAGVLAGAFRSMSGQVEQRTAELQATNEQLHREIFERRQAEEEIFRLNAQLEQRVAERTAELVKANEQYQQVIIAQRDAENELLRSREELRSLSAYQQSVREEERKRISREIHDELGQSLTAMKLDLSWLGKKFRKDQTALCEKTGSMTALVESVIQTVQRISSELRPGMLDDLGLKEAMEWEMKGFQQRTGIAGEFSFDPIHFNGNAECRTTIFRIFQEALTNVVRHSQATKVSVMLEEQADMLALSIRDNGRGITDKEITDPKSLGLIGIRERARLCGGEVEISGSPQKGTMVKVIIPLDGKEEPT